VRSARKIKGRNTGIKQGAKRIKGRKGQKRDLQERERGKVEEVLAGFS
jgi:hypothetical protein